MRRRTCMLLASLFSVQIAGAPIDATSREIVRVVLSSALEDVVRDWEITDPNAELIIADRTIPCALPGSQEDLRRMNEATERILAGEKVPDDAFTPSPVDPDQDLVTHSGRVIPRELVRRCWLNQPEVQIPSMTLSAPVGVTFESSAVVDRLFREDHETWKKLHPNARGVLRVSLPVFSQDKQRALVTFSQFTNGIGGAIVLCLVENRHGSWEIAWEEMVLLE